MLLNNEYNNPASVAGAAQDDAYESEGRLLLLAVMDAFVNDPSALGDFATHLVDAVQTKLGWSDADINPITFEEMSDGQLMAHLSEFLGSGQINVSINGGTIEAAQTYVDISQMTEEQLAEADIADPRVTAAKLRKASVEAAKDAAERDHDRRMEESRELTQQEQIILSGQSISLGGKTATALSWANALRKIQKNWDKSFDEMVAQGLAKPEEKDKKAEEIQRLYKLMTRTDISEAEKQKLINEGLANGEYSQGSVTYTTREVEKLQSKNAAADVGIDKDRQEISNMTRQTASVPVEDSVSADTSVDAKPVTEKSAADQDFPSAKGIEIRNNFAGAAANVNTPVVEKDPAPVMVAKAKVENSFAAF